MWNKAAQAQTQQEGQPTRRNTHRRKDNQQDKHTHTHIGTITNWKKDAQVGSRRNKEEQAGAEEEGETIRRDDMRNDNL